MEFPFLLLRYMGFLTLPDIQNILVPVFFGLPKDANHLAPFLKIVGITAIVSTLLTIVGHPYKTNKSRKRRFKSRLTFVSFYAFK